VVSLNENFAPVPLILPVAVKAPVTFTSVLLVPPILIELSTALEASSPIATDFIPVAEADCEIVHFP
jgi:hypothetical protein